MTGFAPLGGAPLGSTGTVIKDFTLPAEAGMLALQPGSAQFVHAWRFAAGSGQLALAAGTAQFQHSWIIDADGGSLALQPGTAQFTHAWRLTANGAALVLEPSSAAFSRHGVLRADPGKLALQAGTARFLPHRNTVADGGTVALQPGTATFRPIQYLNADGGSLALQPGSVLIRSHRRFPAAGATVALQPGTATLRFEHTITAARGSLAITGGAATFRPTFKLPANGGTLAITGGSALFRLKAPPAVMPARVPTSYGVLVHMTPLDPTTGERVDIYASSFGKRLEAFVNAHDGHVWEPCITQRPKIGITLWDGDFTDSIKPAGASLPLNLDILRKTYPNAAALNWTGARIEIHIGRAMDAWPWPKTFKGVVSSYGGEYPALTLQARVDTEPFDRDVLTRTYAGTGGIEGPTDLKNRLKPLVFGWAKNVEPVLINEVDSVYQFSGYGAIEAVTTLYERGSDFGASIGDYATYAALLAATIPPGRWATCLAQGLIRLGAPQAGVITGDIKGHVPTGTTTPRLTGQIISALATMTEVPPDYVHSASLAALDTAVPYPINVVITEQTTFLALAKRLALPCNWLAGVGIDGALFVSRPSFTPGEQLTLDSKGRAVPQVTAAEEIDVSPPFFKTTMGAAKSWRVQSAEEVALDYPIVPTGRYSDTRTYRQGEAVNLIDGSEWVYINETPSAGNPPPIWPTTSNAWWENMTPPSDVLSTQIAIRTAAIRNTRTTSNVARNLLYATTAGSTSTISVARHDWDYPNGSEDVTRELGTITGLTPDTDYYVYFDDSTLADLDPVYAVTTNGDTGSNTSTNPNRHPLGSIRTPAVGEGQTVGGTWPGYNYQSLRALDDLASTVYAQNNRDPSPIIAAIVPSDGTAVDHVLGVNGSASISFEWTWFGKEADIDGWEVMVYASTSSFPYTPGTAPYAEAIADMSPSRRATTIQGVDPTYHYTFAVRAYRIVDEDVAPGGRINGAWIKPSLSTENPYRPESNVAWTGNVTGTINGTAASNVASWSSYAYFGLNSDGSVRPNMVGTSAILNQALVAAGYATQSALLTMSPGETVTWGMISSQYVANGKRIVVDMNINYLLYITNPAQTGYYGASFYILLQGPYGSYLSNEDYQHIQWEAPSASGSFITDRKTLSLQFVFNNVPPGYYSAAYRIVCPGTNGLWTFPYRYMKMNELKATE